MVGACGLPCFAGGRDESGGSGDADGVRRDQRIRLHRRVRIIVAVTITWNLVEAIVAISAGVAASSAALIGFGLDSVIEVASAAAIAWQFTRKDPKRWEKVTVRAIGIGIAVASLIVMPVLAWFEFRTGRELGSKSVQADARQLLLCVYLSGTVLVGLLLNSLFGWMWADSVAALFVAALATREGIEAWHGDVESPFDVLEDLPRDTEQGRSRGNVGGFVQS